MGGRGNYAIKRLTTLSNTSLVRETAGGGGGGEAARDIDYTQTKISGAAGSNEGGVYRGSDGVERYVKFYKDPTQAFGEALANKIYRDLGIDAPEAVVFTAANGKTAFASKMIKDPKDIGKPTTRDTAKKIMRGYAADVLMANRDVVGLTNDNIKLSGDKVYRIDNGSAFLHRAMGSRKDVGDLNKISEFEYFVNTSSQYKAITRLAGVNNVSDLGKNVNRQINVITRLRNKNGSWDKYITSNFPNWKGSDRNRISEMLEARTKELVKRLK